MFTQEQIEGIGGRVWTGRGGVTRVYLKRWKALIDLEVSYYNTGNISGATIRGEEISNARARRLLSCEADTTVYWEDGEIYVTGNPTLEAHMRDLIAGITEAIQAKGLWVPVEPEPAARDIEPEPTEPQWTPDPIAMTVPVVGAPEGAVWAELPDSDVATLIIPADRTIRVWLPALSPKARAVAEAIEAEGRGFQRHIGGIRIKSIAPEADTYRLPLDQRERYIKMYGLSDTEPALGRYDWIATAHLVDHYGILRWLEREAAKMDGWYPVRQDGSDLPSSQAAREVAIGVAA